jgi:hypothetical protein
MKTSGILVGEILQVAFTGHVLVGRKHPPRHGYMMYGMQYRKTYFIESWVVSVGGLVLLVCLWAVRLKRVIG